MSKPIIGYIQLRNSEKKFRLSYSFKYVNSHKEEIWTYYIDFRSYETWQQAIQAKRDLEQQEYRCKIEHIQKDSYEIFLNYRTLRMIEEVSYKAKRGML